MSFGPKKQKSLQAPQGQLPDVEPHQLTPRTVGEPIVLKTTNGMSPETCFAANAISKSSTFEDS
tara:strand:- start:505 stop:696 length:192 start_codon:yes stop_codon:yes gene_type:complete